MFKEFDAEKQFRVSMEDLKATFDVMKLFLCYFWQKHSEKHFFNEVNMRF